MLLTFGGRVPNIQNVLTSLPTPTQDGARPWQSVALEQGYTLALLVKSIGRTHNTMLAYSCGKRRVPQVVLIAMGHVLGEPVR